MVDGNRVFNVVHDDRVDAGVFVSLDCASRDSGNLRPVAFQTAERHIGGHVICRYVVTARLEHARSTLLDVLAGQAGHGRADARNVVRDLFQGTVDFIAALLEGRLVSLGADGAEVARPCRDGADGRLGVAGGNRRHTCRVGGSNGRATDTADFASRVVLESTVANLSGQVIVKRFLHPLLGGTGVRHGVDPAVDAVDLHFHVHLAEHSYVLKVEVQIAVFRSLEVVRKFTDNRVVQGVVYVEVPTDNRVFAELEVRRQGLVVYPCSSRHDLDSDRAVVELVLTDVQTLSAHRLHGSVHVCRENVSVRHVFVNALDPFEELVAVSRGDADVIGAFRASHALVHADGAVGGDDPGGGDASTRVTGTPDRLGSPQEHAVRVVDLDTVRLGLVHDSREATVVVHDNPLRIPRAVEVGICYSRVVRASQKDKDVAVRKVGSVLSLKLQGIRV